MNKETGSMLKELFQASYFRMTVVPDGDTVELCGALKVSFFLHTSQSCTVPIITALTITTNILLLLFSSFAFFGVFLDFM